MIRKVSLPGRIKKAMAPPQRGHRPIRRGSRAAAGRGYRPDGFDNSMYMSQFVEQAD